MSPVYFCASQAIELAFKAYARSFGAAEDDLRSCGHDLIKALGLAQKHGFAPDQRTIETVELLSPLHRQNMFRYHQAGLRRVPLLGELVETMRVLIGEIGPVIHARLREELREAKR